jgi:hypothetical protein
MPDNDATLRDATIQVEGTTGEGAGTAHTTQSNPAETAQPAKAGPPALHATVQDTADKDAAELGRLLIESGYSKNKINELLAAPNALQSIQHLVRNNPQEFLTMLERTDPEAARNFHEKMADMYVERYQVRERPQNGKSGAADSELMAEVEALREKVSQAETREIQREQLKTMAAVQARYNARVDELFNHEDIKKMQLTPAEKKGMRARLDSELARDPAAAQRLNNGNFFDVPRRFKDIIEEWANDKKTAGEAAKAQRERAARASAFEFPNGPNPIAVDPKSFADSWEQTEEAFAQGLEKFAQ